MVVPVEPGPNLRVGLAETLFDAGAYYDLGFWDVSPDGQRLLMLKVLDAAMTDADGQPEIILVQNWFEELTRVVPVD